MDKRNCGLHIKRYVIQPEKNEIMIYVTAWMNLENIMLSEISQTPMGRYFMIPLI